MKIEFSQEGFSMVAERFKVLAEPIRLRMLYLLKQGELTVTELTSKCSTSQPNASKHLKVLTDHGILRRDQRGNAVFYSIADESIFDLCDLVCDSIGERLQAQAKIFAVS